VAIIDASSVRRTDAYHPLSGSGFGGCRFYDFLYAFVKGSIPAVHGISPF
jgi:hypothetical protein